MRETGYKRLMLRYWPDCYWEDQTDGYCPFDFSKAFNLCGCGSPDEVSDFYADLLESLDVGYDSTKDRNNEVQSVLEVGGLKGEWWGSLLVELVLHLIEAQGLTEHGGTTHGSWLTDKGRAAIHLLRLRAKYERGEVWPNG